MSKKEPVVVSACLLGHKCRFDGKACSIPALEEYLTDKEVILICPEQLGGLSTPRPRARIIGKEETADGFSVLSGEAWVVTCEDKDVTESYLEGGRRSLKMAQEAGAKLAILKANSPSCGCGEIFTEDFSEKKSGDGTTTAIFKQAGIEIRSELNYE